jgi:hypothetical protein
VAKSSPTKIWDGVPHVAFLVNLEVRGRKGSGPGELKRKVRVGSTLPFYSRVYLANK